MNSLEKKLESFGKAMAERESAKIYQFPLWGEVQRGVPNEIARSALFTARKGVGSEYLRDVPIFTQNGFSIIYTGGVLTQDHLDIFEGRGASIVFQKLNFPSLCLRIQLKQRLMKSILETIFLNVYSPRNAGGEHDKIYGAWIVEAHRPEDERTRPRAPFTGDERSNRYSGHYQKGRNWDLLRLFTARMGRP